MKPKLIVLVLSFLIHFASAQERLNYLSVDGQLVEGIGPFYFTNYGDSENAYAKAGELAEALGLELHFDPARKLLTFRQGQRAAQLQATGDVTAGLARHANVLRVNGQVYERAIPMGLLVEGVSYVPITPIVEAFGGESAWDADNRVVIVFTALTPPQDAPLLAAPRIGVASGGAPSRVALDLPVGSAYEVAVSGSTLLIRLPGLRTPNFHHDVRGENLQAVRFGTLEGDAALIIDTQYELTTEGAGFQLNYLPSDANRPDHDVLYVDFAPAVRGQPVAALNAEQLVDTLPVNAEPAAAPLSPQRRIVVIDAGHGGKFAGSQGYVAEEDVVLAVSLKLEQLLEQQGIEVVMTRDGDYHLSENYRRDLAARADFAKPEVNLFISIHANGAENSSAHGIETWVFGEPLDNSLIELAIEENGGGSEGQALTQEAAAVADQITGNILREEQLSFSKALAETVQAQLISATGAQDRGVRQNVFYVIRNARTPAILVELGFVSNPEEGRRLATDSYQTTLAEAIAAGVQTFLDSGGAVATR